MGNGRSQLDRIDGFTTVDAEAVPVVSAAAMRALDDAAAMIGFHIAQMAEHAGRHLADLVRELGTWSRTSPRVVVLAGSGGNGAGAIAAARHLANGGAEVRVLLAPPADAVGPAVTAQLEVLRSADIEVTVEPAALPGGADVIVDGLVGYGIRGTLRAIPRRLVEATNGQSGALVVSLDVPSGMHPDEVTQAEPFVHPAATLTVALPKCCLLNQAAGDVWLADIGLPRGLFATVGLVAPPIAVSRQGLVRLRRYTVP